MSRNPWDANGPGAGLGDFVAQYVRDGGAGSKASAAALSRLAGGDNSGLELLQALSDVAAIDAARNEVSLGSASRQLALDRGPCVR